ncbi:MAG: tetratricopeptide repeat protein [Candidatus Amoebophilus sp.]
MTFIKTLQKYQLLTHFKFVVYGLLYSLSIPTIATQQVPIQYFTLTSWLITQQSSLNNTQSEQESNQEASTTDPAKKLNELIERAEKGDAKAQYEVGRKYYQGKKISQDYKQAFKWFTKVEAQGNVDAQVAIASMYYHGQGVQQNYEEAFKWFTKAKE